MSSKFGRLPYGTSVYSRDFSHGRYIVRAGSLVTVNAGVERKGAVAIMANSSASVIGRLEWEHLTIEPCEGQWAALVNPPCRRAA
jgi:hypothetical protein